MKQMALAIFVVLVLASGAAQAALNDRGGGLLYDDVLNVTWLQDANYAKTSGYDNDGLMDWNAANTWAANLTFYDSVRNVNYSDWRLASNSPVNGANWNYIFADNGSTDVGYNITSPHSEMGYMYYVNLGLKGFLSSSGIAQSDYGIFGNGKTYGQNNLGPVKNLQGFSYWSGTAASQNPAPNAWRFYTDKGNQRSSYQGNSSFAWAVRPGDVAAVPEPESYVLLMAGLGLLSVAARRRRQTATKSKGPGSNFHRCPNRITPEAYTQ